MTARRRLAIAALGFAMAAALLFIDRAIAGFVQCEAALACPNLGE